MEFIHPLNMLIINENDGHFFRQRRDVLFVVNMKVCVFSYMHHCNSRSSLVT